MGYASAAVACINYCVSKGAKVISASWSGGGFSTATRDAIAAAGAAGVLFVSSAGNKAANNDAAPK